MIESAHPGFDVDDFEAFRLDGYDELELTPRARQIAGGLADFLPSDRERALRIVTESLDERIEGDELSGMAGFTYLPHVIFVAEHGLDHFETAIAAQYELTTRFTAEFSIRPYLERHRAKTLDRLHTWARDPNAHVRRLVSEGARPRLP